MADRRRDVVEVYPRVDGRWAWRRVAPNGTVVAREGEAFAERGPCITMAVDVNAPFARLELLEEDLRAPAAGGHPDPLPGAVHARGGRVGPSRAEVRALREADQAAEAREDAADAVAPFEGGDGSTVGEAGGGNA